MCTSHNIDYSCIDADKVRFIKNILYLHTYSFVILILNLIMKNFKVLKYSWLSTWRIFKTFIYICTVFYLILSYGYTLIPV